ncbi:MAG: hypothetical protein H6R44_1084, partial [Nitrospirae bacterium]|nr:hypothetical protein [Nitrospirota bacterium]
ETGGKYLSLFFRDILSVISVGNNPFTVPVLVLLERSLP